MTTTTTIENTFHGAGNAASFGRVVSAHRTRKAAERELMRRGCGCVEPAIVAQLVQGGMCATDAYQETRGLPVEFCEVRVES